jgi:hypothetical protein
VRRHQRHGRSGAGLAPRVKGHGDGSADHDTHRNTRSQGSCSGCRAAPAHVAAQRAYAANASSCNGWQLRCATRLWSCSRSSRPGSTTSGLRRHGQRASRCRKRRKPEGDSGAAAEILRHGTARQEGQQGLQCATHELAGLCHGAVRALSPRASADRPKAALPPRLDWPSRCGPPLTPLHATQGNAEG